MAELELSFDCALPTAERSIKSMTHGDSTQLGVTATCSAWTDFFTVRLSPVKDSWYDIVPLYEVLAAPWIDSLLSGLIN